VTFNAEQLAAISRATGTDRVTLISGGAGTGKTTIAKAICDRLDENKEPYLLCAFAGKAAARLREATERSASTIHRMLQFNGSQFLASEDALVGVTIICDESSMLESHLLAEIIKRQPKRLILIGDQAQLPPVGKGQPYHDLIVLRHDLSVKLTRCYRATEAIFQAATSIRDGITPPTSINSPGESWAMINTGDAKRTQQQVIDWVFAEGSWDWETDVILVPRNGENAEEDFATVRGLNHAIANRIAPRDKKTVFVVGDRVINGKNLPDIDCWNGTTGTISAIDIDGGIWVKTDSDVIDMARSTPDKPKYTDRVLFGKSIRGNLSLAYAMTCHKAQGSQYRRVCVICLDRDTHCLLDRSWVYTAITRAREVAVVCGQVSALKAAINQVASKHTVIQELAQGES
jgi:exodeoxyribonuclease V alpha subunit